MLFRSGFALVLISPFVNSFIIGNYFENDSWDVIYVIGYQNTSTTPTTGRYPENSTRVYIVNNELTNIHDDGIEPLYGVSDSVISHNYIHDSPLANSILMGHMNSILLWVNSSNIQVNNNVIANMAGDPSKYAHGILLADSHHNTVRNNVISNVADHGIFLLWDSAGWSKTTDNIIKDNIIFNAPKYGYLNRVNSENLTNLNTVIINK